LIIGCLHASKQHDKEQAVSTVEFPLWICYSSCYFAMGVEFRPDKPGIKKLEYRDGNMIFGAKFLTQDLPPWMPVSRSDQMMSFSSWV